MVVEKVIIERLTGPGYGLLAVTAATMALIFFFEGAAGMAFGLMAKGMATVLPGSLTWVHSVLAIKKLPSSFLP